MRLNWKRAVKVKTKIWIFGVRKNFHRNPFELPNLVEGWLCCNADPFLEDCVKYCFHLFTDEESEDIFFGENSPERSSTWRNGGFCPINLFLFYVNFNLLHLIPMIVFCVTFVTLLDELNLKKKLKISVL